MREKKKITKKKGEKYETKNPFYAIEKNHFTEKMLKKRNFLETFQNAKEKLWK